MKQDVMLHRTRRGTAIRCGCCGRVEVTLGNAILRLDPADLRSVLEIVESFDVSREGERTPSRRCFVIRTERDDAAFIFDRDEVLELHDLLRNARERLLTESTPWTLAPFIPGSDPVLN